MINACAYEVRGDIAADGSARVVLRFLASDEGEGWQQDLTLAEARKLAASLVRAAEAIERGH